MYGKIYCKSDRKNTKQLKNGDVENRQGITFQTNVEEELAFIIEFPREEDLTNGEKYQEIHFDFILRKMAVSI